MIDKIEFYLYCENMTIHEGRTSCKYDWYFTFLKFANSFTTMIYSEGE